MNKLLKIQAVTPNANEEQNREFLMEFARTHGWNVSFSRRFATYKFRGQEKEIPFKMNPLEFINYVLNIYTETDD